MPPRGKLYEADDCHPAAWVKTGAKLACSSVQWSPNSQGFNVAQKEILGPSKPPSRQQRPSR